MIDSFEKWLVFLGPCYYHSVFKSFFSRIGVFPYLSNPKLTNGTTWSDGYTDARWEDMRVFLKRGVEKFVVRHVSIKRDAPEK